MLVCGDDSRYVNKHKNNDISVKGARFFCVQTTIKLLECECFVYIITLHQHTATITSQRPSSQSTSPILLCFSRLYMYFPYYTLNKIGRGNLDGLNFDLLPCLPLRFLLFFSFSFAASFFAACTHVSSNLFLQGKNLAPRNY